MPLKSLDTVPFLGLFVDVQLGQLGRSLPQKTPGTPNMKTLAASEWVLLGR